MGSSELRAICGAVAMQWRNILLEVAKYCLQRQFLGHIL
jgi:hypothetical protein